MVRPGAPPRIDRTARRRSAGPSIGHNCPMADAGNQGIKQTFGQAARFFVDTAALVRPDQWAQPGLGVWTVRDLVGHGSRSLLTVETYLGRPATAVEVATPS